MRDMNMSKNYCREIEGMDWKKLLRRPAMKSQA